MQDQNFDAIANKFTRNIYGTIKGKIRLAVLRRDLQQVLNIENSPALRILDAGGGYGHLSQQLAAMGHQVVLCDISEQLLAQAHEQIAAAPTPLDIQLLHCPIQQLDVEQLGQFDLILCHAVVEWLSDAKATVAGLLPLLKPGGHLSLMFYNREAQRFHSLVSGNFDYINKGLKVKKPVRLTPQHPLTLDEVEQWMQQWLLTSKQVSGVRIINDYFKAGAREQVDEQQIIDMELRYSQHRPFIELGRYIHLLAQR